jgi:hypothetical protein
MLLTEGRNIMSEELIQLGGQIERNDGQTNFGLMNPKQKKLAKKSVEDNTIPPLNAYQKKILDEFQKRPEVIKLLKDYPAAVIEETRRLNYVKSRKQKEKANEAVVMRLQIESWIEREIAKLIGVDVENLESQIEPEVTETIEQSAEDTQQAVEKMAETPTEEEVIAEDIEKVTKKKTTKKKTTKKTKKKVSKKKTTKKS